MTPIDELVKRLREYARDWRDRAASADIVHEAADALLAEREAREKAERELDEALNRVDELEGYQEKISEEFEKDCWVAMRSLLNECKFDWSYDHDGITADDAREYISETMRDLDRHRINSDARATAAEAELAKVREALGQLRTMVQDSPTALAGMVCDAIDITLAAVKPPKAP